MLPSMVYRAHWEDPLTRFFEQLFGPLEWNVLAVQDHYQCIWYSYFHPYPIFISNSTELVNHHWQNLVQRYQLPQSLTLTFHHHKPSFSNAITSYSEDRNSGGLSVVSKHLSCSIDTLTNFPYQTLTELPESSLPPQELITTLQQWMCKASKALIMLAATNPQWYQQRLLFQPVEVNWWHRVIQNQQRLINLLRDGLTTGTIPCEHLKSVVPFDVPPTTVTFTTPTSPTIVSVSEALLGHHHQQLSKVIELVKDPNATTLLMSEVLESWQILCDSNKTTMNYPPIPSFEGHRILRIQGDSPVILHQINENTEDGRILEWPSSTSYPRIEYPLILDSYTSDLTDYTNEQLIFLLRYINGLQDSDGSGDNKYVLLQNRIIHTLGERRHRHHRNFASSSGDYDSM